MSVREVGRSQVAGLADVTQRRADLATTWG
jgi:hypothetical protein